jgi:CheY-like chemotaxis protein
MTLLKVLVVDDDRAIRDSLREVLLAEGYDVVIAENGAVALQIMRSQPPPDVVVLDLMMPVLSGWEVLEQLETDASVRDIPVLVVSAMGAPLASSGQHGGVRMSLPKPPDVDALLAAIEHILLPRACRGPSERPGTISPIR